MASDQTYASVPRPPQTPTNGLNTVEPDQVTNVPTSAADVKRKDILREEGGTGTILVNGFLSGQDYNTDFTGTKRIDVFDEMRKSDATVRAAMLAVKLPLLSADWYIKEPSGQEKLGKVADFADRQLFKNRTFSWTMFLRQALTMCEYGNAIFEKVFEPLPGNKIGWKKLAPRMSKTIYRWTLKDGVSPGIYQILPTGKTAEIPRWKLLYFINEQEGSNYEGISLLRPAHKHWFYKNLYYKIDSIATEKQGMGIPKVTAPPNSTPQDETAVREIAQNMRTNEKAYIKVPQGWNVEFMDMKGNTVKDSKDMIEHHDRQIVKAVLAQFLELGTNAGGSYALSADQSKLFLLGLEYLAKIIQEEMNQAIRELVDLNFPNVGEDEYPTLEYGAIGQIDFDKLSQALQRLSSSSVLTPDLDLEKYVRASMNLPIPEDLAEQREAKAVSLATVPTRPATKEEEDSLEELDSEDDELDDEPPRKNVKAAELEFMQNLLEFSEDVAREIEKRKKDHATAA
jgi:hypothetical protein